jgi:hypothetical protein
MTAKTKRRPTGPKIKPKHRADLYMWAGDLRRALERFDDDTRIYVHIDGPSVQIVDWIYYPVGIEGNKTIQLLTRSADIPKRAPPTLEDLGNILQERHKEAEKREVEHEANTRALIGRYNDMLEVLRAKLKKRKAVARKRRPHTARGTVTSSKRLARKG